MKVAGEQLGNFGLGLVDSLVLQEPAKKPLMVDGSTQTTREISTQTDDLTNAKVTSVAVKTMEQGVQADESEMPATAKYPLQGVDFEVLEVTSDNIEELDPESPEVLPYFENAGEKYIAQLEFNSSIEGKVFNGIANSLKWTAKNIANWFRTSVYQTEYELLRSILDPNQEIRVSNSWFFPSHSSGREVYYGLNHSNPFKMVFINTPKWIWYEGITSVLFGSDKAALLKVFHVLPHVLLEKIGVVNNQISVNVENLARTAITILEDPDYNNISYMQEVESKLEKECLRHLKATSELMIFKMADTTPGLKKVQRLMNAHLEAWYPDGGSYLDQAKDHIDSIKVYTDRFFKVGDEIAQDAIDSYNTLLKESPKYITNSVGDSKGRIYVLLKELLRLRASTQQSFDHLKASAEQFEKLIKS